ncbi:sensor histidine kinase [Pedobacter sp. GR22-6]|uniref:sensor histidine kinase n=1 Tax=Pedobacter sp. GR22-6 TaxID=3127957 RepID=UPI00307CEBA1
MSLRNSRNEMAGLIAENRLLRDKAELAELVERTSNLGSWEIDLGNQSVRWSEELYRIYGFSSNNFLPDSALNEEIIIPEYREKVAKELAAAVVNRTSFAVEYQVALPSGTRKYILGQGSYVSKDHKIVGTIQDITELKDAVLKLKVNESLLREAEAVSHNGSWELADGKEFMLWSDEMYIIHGFLPHSVFINLRFYRSLVHEDDLAHFLESFSQAGQQKNAFKINYRIIRPSGEIRHVLSIAEYKKIGLDDRYAYIGTTQDVTELREAQVQLEEKVIELNRSNQDLEQFAYVASHDLQEPLRKIQAFGERLMKKSFVGLDEEAVDYIERMRKASERMRKLIDDLLTFSKATREPRHFAKINLANLLQRTLKDLDFYIEQKKATIHLSLELEVEGIESQLSQLFQNLIGNALKFTAAGIDPIISITGKKVNGMTLGLPEVNQNQWYGVIEVSDNGIGFEKQDAERIFDIFHRLHSRSDYEGTGIGLAICKKIVSNHSGFISAFSEQGKGTTFSVILPLKQSK